MHRKDAITTIRLLSLCLRGRKVPPHDEFEDFIRSRIPASGKEDHQLSLLGHLLTMLDTGSRPELFPAVTSEVMKDAVLLTVVVSSGSDAHIQATPPPSTTTEIIPNSMSLENINNPLTGTQEGHAPTFKQHLSDVAGVLCLLGSVQDQTPVFPLSRWLVIRCHKRIKARFRSCAQGWIKVPWEVMKNWQGPALGDMEVESSRIKVSKNMMTYLPLTELPYDGESVPFDRDTVQTWIVGLGELLSFANEQCAEDDMESLFDLSDALAGTLFLLDLPQIQKILCDTRSLAKDFNNTLPKRGESAGAYVLRNVQTLVAWPAAAHAAVSFFSHNYRPPLIRLVELADHSSEAIIDIKKNGRSIVDSLKKEITDLYGHMPQNRAEDLYHWIEANLSATLAEEAFCPLRVHAEAGLMALLTEAQAPPGSRADGRNMVEFFSDTQDCVIGVSEKCCYMCRLLKESMLDNVAGHRSLNLSGSHGYIFPWDPPSFGVPDNVLASMAARLREEIIKCAIEQVPTQKNKSQLPSPTSVGEHMEYNLNNSAPGRVPFNRRGR